MPITRAECADVPRPCPFSECRYHLAGCGDSCALDFADRVSARPPRRKLGPHASSSSEMARAPSATTAEVALALGVSDELVRQTERGAIVKLAMYFSPPEVA
jgi:hypothetical protein